VRSAIWPAGLDRDLELEGGAMLARDFSGHAVVVYRHPRKAQNG
jgi:hypothetical protein